MKTPKTTDPNTDPRHHYGEYCECDECTGKPQAQPPKAAYTPDDDGKISREDWRELALSRYANMERYRVHAERLADALRKAKGALNFVYGHHSFCEGQNRAVSEALRESVAALAAYEKEQQ